LTEEKKKKPVTFEGIKAPPPPEPGGDIKPPPSEPTPPLKPTKEKKTQ